MKHEIETKIELSAASFQQLLADCTLLAAIEQLNVYYDCAGAIAMRSGSLRIRFVKGTAPIMTLKLPVERNGGRRVSTEIEERFSGLFPPRQLDTAELPASFREHLRQLCTVRPRRLGAMRTRRNVVRLPSGDVVEMDEVRLPGGQLFHEVEIESDDPAVHASALAAVQRAVPDCRMSERGKFQRFREALRTLQ